MVTAITSTIARVRTSVERHAQLVLVGVVPTLLLALGVAHFTLDHFFVRAPYLLDSGLLSGIAYRSGPLLAPAEIACNYATSFYQVYFSPIVSAISALSYVVPAHRIEWFVFVHAMVYVPIGLAVYSLASHVGPACTLRRLPITIFAALALSFSGLVLWMISYPHYEAATPGLVCLVLAAVVTGRTRLTWIVLALAVSVRQDGGLHVALALAPLVYLKWRGTEMLPSQRRLIVTIGVALAASAAEFACQKLLFVPVDRLHAVYLGTPAYAHLSWSLLADRAHDFVTSCQVIYYPFLGTVLLAVLRRDARYLFGWASTVPWFLFNFTAYDPAKSSFAAYSVGPFLVSMFWVYVYGARLAPAVRRLHPGVIEAVFALLCMSSTLGYHHARPQSLVATVRDMTLPHGWNRAAVHGFVDALHTHRADFGRLYVDDGIAALAMEWLRLEDYWHPHATQPADAIAFHSQGSGVDMLADLSADHLDTCAHVLGTRIFVCSRTRLPETTFAEIETETLSSIFAFTRVHRPGVRIDERGLGLFAGLRLEGPLGQLPRGTYDLTLTVSADTPLALDGSPMVQLDVALGNDPPRSTKVANGAREIVLRFVSDGEQPVHYAIASRSPSPITITGARLRSVTP